ncbi:class I ribonucleotide reductase maintenance protein YfaE [Shewanella schlegeliana]|uniref:2Fe-2S iron-sulfur cluster binding domain-containing protein n=1 Tax=Shewanella schlegeliana TaxID=190308 RepID=A0ABS1SZM8_9GAMM|nr:class I ribonucleotide reductase maintenance protein YfaE [Shewanella schlegeliana]MBL4913995.1 2Fe-2S iron-sulfur cluster binding domain-containing protein [Shewanella schlegeliana]MCL1108621.1 class I ribonucleotide reductase maintenance protein YfaE [Shewanella schlegeliana]
MTMSFQTLTYKPQDFSQASFKKAPIVSLQGMPVLLFNQQHLTLLEALEQKRVKIFSECRSGYCGQCKTKVKTGKVSYIREPLVTLETDECLPCCCIPDGDIDLALSANGAEMVVRVPDDKSAITKGI